jgi:hypothetical protein
MAGKMTPLESGLIVRKGHAVPASPREVPTNDMEDAAEKLSRAGRIRGGTIAITVRLDPDRYGHLKSVGLKHGLTNQEIMVTALDEWFRKGNDT